jgi:hypothetical protein
MIVACPVQPSGVTGRFEETMKGKVSLPGLLFGLVAGLVAGLILSHFIGWLLIGLALVAVIAVVRIQRGRKIGKLAKA